MEDKNKDCTPESSIFARPSRVVRRTIQILLAPGRIVSL